MRAHEFYGTVLCGTLIEFKHYVISDTL